MSLADLKIGETAKIDKILGNEKLAKRLLALGALEGTEIELKNKAPFGDPLIFNIRGFNLALRKSDAKNIVIKDINAIAAAKLKEAY